MMVDTAPRADEATATVLVVDDRPELVNALERSLRQNGYKVCTAVDGEAALTMALDLRPDLVILDLGLPKRDGLDVARALRERGFTAPVLMLTGRGATSDKVSGLDAGADDYLAKPFEYDELLARVKALLRRTAYRGRGKVLRVGPFTLDPLAREVTQDGRPLALTQREYALLEFFLHHPGQPVTRETIWEHVWRQEVDSTTNIVDVYVKYLRKKLDDGSSLLKTIRGVGYILMVE